MNGDPCGGVEAGRVVAVDRLRGEHALDVADADLLRAAHQLVRRPADGDAAGVRVVLDGLVVGGDAFGEPGRLRRHDLGAHVVDQLVLDQVELERLARRRHHDQRLKQNVREVTVDLAGRKVRPAPVDDDDREPADVDIGRRAEDRQQRGAKLLQVGQHRAAGGRVVVGAQPEVSAFELRPRGTTGGGAGRQVAAGRRQSGQRQQGRGRNDDPPATNHALSRTGRTGAWPCRTRSP